MRLAGCRLAALVVAAVLLTACSTSKDAVETGQDFTFVAPGGQTTILYDPPESRGALRELSGESLLDPGTTVGLENFAGRVVVLNIWGSWCGPCRVEAPDLQFVAQQTAADGVSVLGVDVRDDRAAAADFVRDRGHHLRLRVRPSRSDAGRAARLPAQHRAVDDRARPAAPRRGGVPDLDPGARADPAGAAPGRRTGPVAADALPSTRPAR